MCWMLYFELIRAYQRGCALTSSLTTLGYAGRGRDAVQLEGGLDDHRRERRQLCILCAVNKLPGALVAQGVRRPFHVHR